MKNTSISKHRRRHLELQIHEDLKVYSKDEIPILHEKSTEFSIEVITCNEYGGMSIGYYSYESKEWYFGCDDDFYGNPFEQEDFKDFVWMYKPEKLKV